MSFMDVKSASMALGAGLFLTGAAWMFGFDQSKPGDTPILLANASGVDQTSRQRTGKRVAAGLGIVEPESGIINLSALMPGVIAKIAKAEGDAIKRGDVIVELINDDLKAQLAQAQSNVRIEAARLAIVENGPRPEVIDQAEAKVRELTSSTKLFETQVQRRQVLAREGAVARETLNEAQRALTVSQQQLEAAKNELDMLRQGSRSEELEAARATYKLAQEKLAEAEAMLDKSFVRATVNGVVLRRYVEPGEAVSLQAGGSILQIADTSRLVVRTQIDENDISGLKIGQKAEITAASLDGKSLAGTVTRISPRLGAKTVTAETPTEKRDTRVLDVIVALDHGVSVPIYLRVDVVIDLDSPPKPSTLQGMLDEPLRLAGDEDNCLVRGCAEALNFPDFQLTGSIKP